MTPANPSTPEVTRADREAAASLAEWHSRVASEWETVNGGTMQWFTPSFPAATRQGTWDEHEFVQAFARHRILHSPARGGDELREALETLFDQAFTDGISVGKSGDESLLAGSAAAYARSALNLAASTDMAGAVEGVETKVRQTTPIVADYGEHFLIAHVSRDGKMVGIDHPCDTVWADVMTAHVALRDRINERIAQQDGCPFKPASSSVEGLTSGEGWQLVPVEPTEAMWEAFDGYNGDKRTGYDTWRKAWSAMLAASPKATATASVREDRFANDAAAKALYDTWADQPGWLPWVDRGNSDMQERARREVML